MPVGNRRSDLEIIREILRMGEASTASLRYGVNLSHWQMQKYLAFLERSNLIKLERHENRALSFRVCQRGALVLDKLDQLFELLGMESWHEFRGQH